jgi:4-hydroxy-tetrahydrodipicolinate reductase
MNIALIGYGKMGKAIEAIAKERGHIISAIIDTHNHDEIEGEAFKKSDVAIEFTSPESAVENIYTSLEAGVPIVVGSTGWLEKLDGVKQQVVEKNGGFLQASNFSIGVNIFFEINKKLAKLMAGQNTYDVQVTEVHHTAKKDAPSGTGITIAEQILEASPIKKSWVNEPTEDASELFIESQRIDPAPGTHIVKWTSAIDDIEIIHTAHNRQGFALGAVLAAEFLAGKKGVFTMQDVLGL